VLVDPTFTVPKPRLEGVTDAPFPAVPPVPVSDDVCGLLATLSETDSVAERAPVVVGLNTTATVQLADAARVAPHVLDEMLKSLVLEPVKAMLLIVIDVALPFVNVAVCGALDVPTLSDPKAMLVGLKVTVPPPVPVPVPESATTWGLFEALSLNCKLAVRVPEAFGEKMIFAVQLAETASVLPQVLLNMEKSDGLVPVMVMLFIVSDVVPPFVSVTTF